MNMRSMLLWLALVIPAGFGLHQLKLEVQTLEENLTSIRRDTGRDKEAIQVLRAEWSYLNEPSRIEQLSERHLDLGSAGAGQILSIDEIPLRGSEEHPVETASAAAVASAQPLAGAGLPSLPKGAPAAFFAPAQLEPDLGDEAMAAPSDLSKTPDPSKVRPRAQAQARLPAEAAPRTASRIAGQLLERLR